MMYRYDSSMLYIDGTRQLFLDNMIIESVQDVTRRWHRPEPISENPIIVSDQPWEHVTYFSCITWSVLRDPADDLFKCWYTDWVFDPEACARGGGTLSGLQMSRFRLLYAYSTDGIHWEKPGLGLVDEDGYNTNICLGDDQHSIYCCSVIADPLEEDSAKRFKTLYEQRAEQWSGVGAAHSADGIHWTPYQQRPQFGRCGPHLGDVYIMSCNTDARQYVAAVRHPRMTAAPLNPRTPRTDSFIRPYFPQAISASNKRRVWQTESSDFLHWREPYLILAPDEEDNLDDAYYGLAQWQAGEFRMGILNTLHAVENTMDVRLVFSRDGKNWRQAMHRQPYIRRGGPGSWNEFMITVPSVPVEVGDELYVFFAGARNHHDWWMRGIYEELDVPEAKDMGEVAYSLGLAKLRKDGYCSLDADCVREGIFVTQPFHSAGEKLVINACCGEDGYIEVEMVDLADEVVTGHSREDCDRFTGDSVRHTVSWQDNPDAAYADFRKLRFYMRNAQLYSFELES